MAASSKYRRRHLVDTDPIVFPPPAVATRPDCIPPDFDPSSDLMLDPYGNIYCFVCQVSVPKGSSNLSQHLEGKKHDTNNKRFVSERQKLAVRSRYMAAATEQRAAIPDLPPEVPVSLPPPSIPVGNPAPIASASAQNPPQSSASNTPNTPANGQPAEASTKDRMKKAKRAELAKKYKAVSIDKSAFLKSLFSEDEKDETNDSVDHPDPDANAEEGNPSSGSVSASIDLEERTKPFAPLNFKPPPFPVSFDDATAEESEPTHTAAAIRELLSSAPIVKADKKHDDGKKPDVKASGKNEPNPYDSNGDTPADSKEEAGAFIRIPADAKVGSEKEDDAEMEKEKQTARESMLVLKDRNGEELPPWLLDSEATQNVLYSGDSSIALHFEILQFSRFVSPTEDELNSRNEMIMTVESIVKQLWPNSTADVFGSYATDLYLPTSDIDICVLGTPDCGDLKEFEQLASAIRNIKGFARRVHVIKAKVPLVKIISRKTSMNCDICIGRDNGPKNVPVIKKYLSTYPALRPLLMVVKCFLQQRDLNETFSGGLGSYTILLLVVSHLQMLKYNFPTSKANLGAVLQAFFQFYGRMFNLCIAGIRVKDNGSYFDKFDKYETAPQDTMRFSVEDPNDETNELGRNGYAATRVRKAFNNASVTLINWRRDDSSAAPTPLGAILQHDDLMRIRRKKVVENMEGKGLQPMRESISEGTRGVKRPLRSSHRSDDVQEENNGSRRSEGTSSRQPYSPTHGRERDPRERDPWERDPRERDPRERDPRGRDPRERDRRDRDPRERGSRERTTRERDPRERDPRLAKRRRSAPGQDGERSREGGSATAFYASEGANNVRPQGGSGLNNHGNQNHRNHDASQNMTSGGYRGVSDANTYDSVYRNQPNFPKYPVPQFPVSTPGYQYVDHQTGYASNGVVSPPVYAAPGYVPMPQQGVQQMPEDVPSSYGQNQMYGSGRRGRTAKSRGAYPRRGGYRGR